MPTVIDSLIVELGLDPSKFKEGQKQAVDQLKKFETEAARHGKEVQKHVGGMEQSFSLLQKRILGVAGLFLGGMGIQQFIQHVTRLNTALGNTATTVGMTAGGLRAWQQAGERFGFSGDAVAGGIGAITNQRSREINLREPSSIARFQYNVNAGGRGNRVDLMTPGPNGGMPVLKDNEAVMQNLAKWLENETKAGRGTEGQAALRDVAGLPQEFVQFLSKGPAEIKRVLEQTKKLAPTDEEVKNFQKLNEAFEAASQSAQRLGTDIVDHVVKPLTELLQEVDKWFKFWHGDEQTKKQVDKEGAELGDKLRDRFGDPREKLKNLGGKDGERLYDWLTGNKGGNKDVQENTEELRKLNERLKSGGVQNQGFLGSGFNSNNVIPASFSGGGAQYGGGEDGRPAWSSSKANRSGNDGGEIPSPSTKIGGGYSSKKSAVQSDIARQFRAAGVDDKGVAAIFANVQRESGFNPTLRHADQPKFGGEAHYAHGLYQEGGTEWNNYAAWLKKNYGEGADWKDPRLQTQFMIHNLQSQKQYRGVWSALQNPKLSAGQKALIFQKGYLRPKFTHPGDASAAERFLRNLPPSDTAGEGVPLPRPHPLGSNEHSLNTLMNGSQFAATGDMRRYSNSMNIGDVHIHTAATDARGIASSIRGSLERFARVTSANYGQA